MSNTGGAITLFFLLFVPILNLLKKFAKSNSRPLLSQKELAGEEESDMN